MERLTRFFMQRRTLFWTLMAGIILFGFISYVRMPKLEDPAVPVKQASVVLIYPGADTHTMELEVAQPVEDAMRSLPDIRKIKTAGSDKCGVQYRDADGRTGTAFRYDTQKGGRRGHAAAARML